MEIGDLIFRITQPVKGFLMAKIGERYVSLVKPTSITYEENKVTVIYGEWKQEITADGEDNERHNFNSIITHV